MPIQFDPGATERHGSFLDQIARGMRKPISEVPEPIKRVGNPGQRRERIRERNQDQRGGREDRNREPEIIPMPPIDGSEEPDPNILPTKSLSQGLSKYWLLIPVAGAILYYIFK